jgi:mannose-6-phosphate isomerase
MAVLLEGRIQRYPWGSQTLIQNLCDWNDTRTIAELWFGAHPKAPSLIAGTQQTLPELLQAHPDWLGPGLQDLPFLLKVIAVEQPLSLQAHPNGAAAKQGYLREEQRGIPLSAPHRSYPDPNHKPELLVALSEFQALAAFDAPRLIEYTFSLIDSADLRRLLDALPLNQLAVAFAGFLRCDPTTKGKLLNALRAACTRHAHLPDARGDKLRIAGRLLDHYPDDLGCLLSLFLQHVVLQPGQALYVPPGMLHCYLSGLAVEIMANSDNVLRCGLTPKHVDIPELLSIIDPLASAHVLQSQYLPGEPDACFPTRATEFLLSSVDLSPDRSLTLEARHAELVLAAHSPILLQDADGSVTVKPGQAAFVAAGTQYTVQGTGPCFRARAGAPGGTIRPSAMN